MSKPVRFIAILIAVNMIALVSYHLYFSARYEIVQVGTAKRPVKYDKWTDTIVIPTR